MAKCVRARQSCDRRRGNPRFFLQECEPRISIPATMRRFNTSESRLATLEFSCSRLGFRRSFPPRLLEPAGSRVRPSSVRGACWFARNNRNRTSRFAADQFHSGQSRGPSTPVGSTRSVMVAWTIQRVTGILLLAYLFLHVRTVSKLSRGPVAFEAMATFASPFFELLEIGGCWASWYFTPSTACASHYWIWELDWRNSAICSGSLRLAWDCWRFSLGDSHIPVCSSEGEVMS